MEQLRVYICAFDQSCKLFLANGIYPSVSCRFVDRYFRRRTGGKSTGTKTVSNKLLATEIPGFFFFLSFLRKEKVTFYSKRLQKYSFHFCICTSCQHTLWVRILHFLSKNKVKTIKVKSTNHMTMKSHLTKSRKVSTKFQFQPFKIAGLYKQVCPQ